MIILIFVLFFFGVEAQNLKHRNLSGNTTSHDLFIVETNYWTASQIVTLALGITLYVLMFLISVGIGYASAELFMKCKNEQKEKEEYKQVSQNDTGFAF